MINKQAVFMVVDDFEPMRKVTANQLRSMGISTIVTAANGAEALRILKKQRVDVILSDWNMPVMAGLELLLSVRADPKMAQMPFIMITAEAERQRIEEAIAAGVSDLLVKPYTADRLATRIEKAMTAQPRSRSVPVDTKIEEPVDFSRKEEGGKEERLTILVVDDTPDNMLLLAHLFEDKYRIRVAHCGQKALHICQSNNPPDLVLLDIMMPGMDGFEVARQMREHPTSASIPLIFVTAMNSDDSRLKGLQLGAVDFVTKPIDPEVIKLRVDNFMRYVEQRKQLQADYDNMQELARLREDVEHITRHDLKGPLAGVIGLVQALESDKLLSHKQSEQLHMVEETALQVLDMINLSSELFKIETGRFTLDAQAVNIGDILNRIVNISRTTFAAKHLSIAFEKGSAGGKALPLVLGDAMLCYSLFQNLIKNACEAAPDRSEVFVNLSNTQPLHITIGNKGAVPLAIREHFFDKYVTFGKQGGSGLGTYSAKMLAEAQNGEIALAVSDQKNQTTVVVTLPLYAGRPAVLVANPFFPA